MEANEMSDESLELKNGKDVILVEAFLKQFPHAEIIKGCIMGHGHTIGIANKDHVLKEDKCEPTVDPDLLMEAMKVLKDTEIFEIGIVQEENLPLRILLKGSNLQILIGTFKKPID